MECGPWKQKTFYHTGSHCYVTVWVAEVGSHSHNIETTPRRQPEQYENSNSPIVECAYDYLLVNGPATAKQIALAIEPHVDAKGYYLQQLMRKYLRRYKFFEIHDYVNDVFVWRAVEDGPDKSVANVQLGGVHKGALKAARQAEGDRVTG